MKMEIEFDVKQITSDGLYSVDDFIRYIDALFERHHLKKLPKQIIYALKKNMNIC